MVDGDFENFDTVAFAKNGIIVFLMDRLMDDGVCVESNDAGRPYEEIDLNFPYVRGNILLTCAHELIHLGEYAPRKWDDENSVAFWEQVTQSHAVKWVEDHRSELMDALGYFVLPDGPITVYPTIAKDIHDIMNDSELSRKM